LISKLWNRHGNIDPQRISSEIERITKLTDVIKTLELAGIEPVGSTPADHEKAVFAKNETMVKASL
jgi:hypothetical protein